MGRMSRREKLLRHSQLKLSYFLFFPILFILPILLIFLQDRKDGQDTKKNCR